MIKAIVNLEIGGKLSIKFHNHNFCFGYSKKHNLCQFRVRLKYTIKCLRCTWAYKNRQECVTWTEVPVLLLYKLCFLYTDIIRFSQYISFFFKVNAYNVWGISFHFHIKSPKFWNFSFMFDTFPISFYPRKSFMNITEFLKLYFPFQYTKATCGLTAKMPSQHLCGYILVSSESLQSKLRCGTRVPSPVWYCLESGLLLFFGFCLASLPSPADSSMCKRALAVPFRFSIPSELLPNDAH